MKIKHFLFIAFLMMSAAAQAQVNINVDARQKGLPISPMLYGIFFEDINHAADGGLYAELIANRSFEDSRDATPAWTAVAAPGAEVSAELVTKKLLNDAQHQALMLKVNASAEAPACLANEGFWGINAVQGQSYRLTFWARGKYKGALKARLCNAGGDRVYAETPLNIKISSTWTKFEATLTPNGNDPKARFVLMAEGKGEITLDVVSLFPPTFKNRENGCRIDLANLLLELKPKFMRFPGGCFVEGQEAPENAFHWEKTVGPIEQREGHLNRNWNYRTSDGLGFHEFLQLSEDLGAKPLYVVNVGLWHGGLTPVEQLQPWIDECMNALEYANGDVSTKYGAMRAANGHPEPFNIEYLEIGNENNQPNPEAQSDRYYERFNLFKDAVLAKYPDMHLIGNVVAWGDDNPKWGSTESVELLDEHYYRNPAWFTGNFRKYDDYPRGGARIYCGEYAVTQGFGKVGSLNAALGEAVFMMGMENNPDVVDMASYAPIFVNENNVAWQPDMIRFNSERVMCTPSYYVQKLLARHVGTRKVEVAVDNPYDYDSKVRITPERSKFGFASWMTQNSYQFVACNTLGGNAVPVRADFGHAQKVRGSWSVDADNVRQTAMEESCLFVNGGEIGSDNYELKVRARKDGGNEGFMVVFNYQDTDNYCWFNLGGWGNTQHGLEQVVNGSKMQVATMPGTVQTGKWYDVSVKVMGDSVVCALDGKQVFAVRLRANTLPGFFANAQLDEKTGEMVVKVVNTSGENTMANISLNGFEAKAAKVIRLSSASGDDENTILNPTNVYPVEMPVDWSGSMPLQVVIPAYSLNILRLR